MSSRHQFILTDTYNQRINSTQTYSILSIFKNELNKIKFQAYLMIRYLHCWSWNGVSGESIEFPLKIKWDCFLISGLLYCCYDAVQIGIKDIWTFDIHINYVTQRRRGGRGGVLNLL